MDLPTHYYLQLHEELQTVAVEGHSDMALARVVELYSREGRFKGLDLSPIMVREGEVQPFNQLITNRYNPDPFTLQIGQDLGEDPDLYTSLVCTGFGGSTLEVVADFARVMGFRPKETSPGFIDSVRDQELFWRMYDDLRKNEILLRTGGLDVKMAFAESLRLQQQTYRR